MTMHAWCSVSDVPLFTGNSELWNGKSKYFQATCVILTKHTVKSDVLVVSISDGSFFANGEEIVLIVAQRLNFLKLLQSSQNPAGAVGRSHPLK